MTVDRTAGFFCKQALLSKGELWLLLRTPWYRVDEKTPALLPNVTLPVIVAAGGSMGTSERMVT